MRKCTNIFTIYEEVVSHICKTLHPIPLNVLIYEENFILFFISVLTLLEALTFRTAGNRQDPTQNTQSRQSA